MVLQSLADTISVQLTPLYPGLHVHTLDVVGPTTLVVHVPCAPHSVPFISQVNIGAPQLGPIILFMHSK